MVISVWCVEMLQVPYLQELLLVSFARSRRAELVEVLLGVSVGSWHPTVYVALDYIVSV
jgi:hypothetical protein